MTTRRNFVRATVALPALAAVPVCAAVCAADPCIVAIKDYQEARRLYLAAIDRDEQEGELDRLARAECLAAVAALCTAPTSAAGLRTFCDFGRWLRTELGGGLADWWPGNNTLVGNIDSRSGEDMYFVTLAEAARRLLPA